MSLCRGQGHGRGRDQTARRLLERAALARQTDAIERAQPECAAFAAALREQARQFRFEAIARELARGAAAEGALR